MSHNNSSYYRKKEDPSNNWTPRATVYDPIKVGSCDAQDIPPHDKAIIRALEANYKPNPENKGNPYKTIFVARLNKKTNQETLIKVFKRYGEIRNCKIVRDLITGSSKGYAFIEFHRESAAKMAERDANKLIIDGSEIFVDFEIQRTLRNWVPRRLGGGFGGKKESGQLRYGGKDRPFKKPIIIPSRQAERD